MEDLSTLALRKGRTALERGELTEALEWLERADQGSGEVVSATAAVRYRLASASITSGAYGDAVSHLNRCPRGSTIPDHLIEERLRLIRKLPGSVADILEMRERFGTECVECSGEDLFTVATCRHQVGAAPLVKKLPPDSLQPVIDEVYAATAYRPGFDRQRGNPLTGLMRIEKREMEHSVMRLLGALLADFLAHHTSLMARADAIVPVPTSRTREERRGGSLPLALATSVRDQLCLPLEEAIVQVGDHLDHTEAAGDLRKRGLRAAWRAKVPSWMQGLGVLLVDDILTTGTTVATAGEMLKDHGVATVYAVALQHTERSS